MTFAAPDSVVSGSPYTVTEVAGHAVRSLSDFAGETEFVIEGRGEHHRITGIGAIQDNGVRFYQKDSCHEGKDVRIWQITGSAQGPFVAEHSAAI